MARIAIVGGGISGLSLGYLLLERGFSREDVLVLEAQERPGGKIRTVKEEGFLCETGVNGFLDNRPRTLELAQALALKPLRSTRSARKRFVLVGGKLRRIPESPPSFLLSGLLSPCGRLRVLGEVLVPPGGGPQESLAQFARRRLGREAYEKLIDPMASGGFAGDPEALEVKSCFPRVKALEEKYGGLIRGMLRLMKEARRTGRRGEAGPGGGLTSFPQGMEALVQALRHALGDSVRTGARVQALEPAPGGYRLHLQQGQSLEAHQVVLACPAYEAASVLQGLDEALAGELRAIPYPALSVLCFGFRRADVEASQVESFGFLIPRREGRLILGCLFDSSIFPFRAPEGHVLLRVMVGGARASEEALAPEERLYRVAMEELRAVLGLRAEPVFFRLFRHHRAIPQYVLGHAQRLRRLQEALRAHPGLHLHGNAYRGVGLNDCVEASYALAQAFQA